MSHVAYILFCHAAAAPNGPEIPHYRGFAIALRNTTLGRTPLDEGSARCRRLYLTTNNTHKRNIVARGGVGTYNSNKRVAADPFSRPRGHWVGCRIHTVAKYTLTLVVTCGLVDRVPTIENNILCRSSGQQWTYCFSLKCR